MSSPRPLRPRGAPRIVICDSDTLLRSVTGVLRVSGYDVFQAHDGHAAEELCALPNVRLLVVNAYRTGIRIGELGRWIRGARPGLPILHIGSSLPDSLPAYVSTLPEVFTPERLLLTVEGLIEAWRKP
jgi:DNA-binding NtrC family response regulator